MIPAARIASSRERLLAGFAITAIALGVCLGFGELIVRLDRHRAEAMAARAETAYAMARADLADVRVDQFARTIAATPRCGHLELEMSLARRRIEVLRRVVWTLVSAGVRWPPDFKGMPSLESALWPQLPERGWDLSVEPMRIVGGEPR